MSSRHSDAKPIRYFDVLAVWTYLLLGTPTAIVTIVYSFAFLTTDPEFGRSFYVQILRNSVKYLVFFGALFIVVVLKSNLIGERTDVLELGVSLGFLLGGGVVWYSIGAVSEPVYVGLLCPFIAFAIALPTAFYRHEYL